MVLMPEKKKGFISRTFNFQGLAFRSGLWFLLGISIVLFVSFGFILAYGLSIMIRDTETHATNITNLTISRIETILRPVEEVTQAMANSVEENAKGIDETMRMSQEYVRTSKVVFGSCLAFEPYAYEKSRKWYAPYFYEDSTGTHSRVLGGKDYDYFTFAWFRDPKNSKQSGWSEPYFDKGGGNALMCTYSVPFYEQQDRDRHFRGVLTMDISLKSLQSIVSGVKVFESGYAVLVSREGRVLTSPNPELVNRNIRNIARDLHNKVIKRRFLKLSRGTELADVTDSILNGRSGFANTGFMMKNGKGGTMYYAPVGKTGWSLIVVFSSEELFSDLLSFLEKLGLITIASIIGAMLITLIVVRKVARPIQKLNQAAIRVGQGDFNAPIPAFKSRNEVGQLARSFSAMQDELQNYIKDLQETTSAKERIESELNVAHEIQVGMLPKVFPSLPECDIYAILKPARAVGGDLYDFFFRDEKHLCFVIGDVSGKSVPASLFMAVTRTLFRAKAQNGASLSSVMESINNELCKDNPNMMFVTFQAAVLDLETGNVEICNAGHNYPFIRRKDNTIRKFIPKQGLALGIMEDAPYSSETITLQPGESIVLYTDGVTEAVSIREDFFMEDKLIQSLLKTSGGSAREIAINLLDDVSEFTREAEQSDDITLLVVKYRGAGRNPEEEMKELRIVNDVHELERIKVLLDELAVTWKIPSKSVLEINLALEEWISNIIFHGFTDKVRHEILLQFIRKKSAMDIIISDDGKPFNPVGHPEPASLGSPVSERAIGGLGIHFINKVMDDIRYSREDNRNILTMTKKLPTK